MADDSAAADAPTRGSVALFDEYKSCLASLEALINGGLVRKKTVLADAASAVERNMEEVRQAAAAVQAEADEHAAGVAERLHMAERHKLAILQHDLSAYRLELENIESFVQDVLQYTAEQPPGTSHSATTRALQLLQRQGELTGRGRRILQAPAAAPHRVASDDLPREVAREREQLAKTAELEQILTVKDQMLWSLLDEAKERSAGFASHSASHAAYVESAQAYAQAAQAGAHDELSHWASLVDE